MTPVIAIVGRPNVGKSTLFNYLTRTRDALVADIPGVTRDRLYGYGYFNNQRFIAIDTGGLGFAESDPVYDRMREQVDTALREANAIILMSDGRRGISSVDQAIAQLLRTLDKPVVVAVNKTDNVTGEVALSEFYELGFDALFPIAASQGQNIHSMLSHLVKFLPDVTDGSAVETGERIHITIAGKPNVGKSTLVNAILKEQRVITSDESGTTRDCVTLPFERSGHGYLLVDTAGIRRRRQTQGNVEKLSIVKSLQSIDKADVVILVIDARDEITTQDLRLLDTIIERGRGLVLAVNKWDGLEQTQKTWIKREVQRRLAFAHFARIHFISAAHGTGVGDLFKSIHEAYDSACLSVNTAQLTRLLEQAVAQHQPPLVKGRRIKLRLAHPAGRMPLRIVIHGKQTERLPDAYRRYLLNYFRKALNAVGAPIKLQFKTDDNPYQSR